MDIHLNVCVHHNCWGVVKKMTKWRERERELIKGYIPSLTNASPTHLLIITATIIGTIYVSPPVSSNIMTINETVILVTPPKVAAAPIIA